MSAAVAAVDDPKKDKAAPIPARRPPKKKTDQKTQGTTSFGSLTHCMIAWIHWFAAAEKKRLQDEAKKKLNDEKKALDSLDTKAITAAIDTNATADGVAAVLGSPPAIGDSFKCAKCGHENVPVKQKKVRAYGSEWSSATIRANYAAVAVCSE